MKKALSIGLLVSLLVNLFMLYKFVLAGNTVEVPNDNRTGIIISEKNRDFVLHEMRTFLEGVKAIHEGISENDYAKIEKNAAISGRAVEDHVPPELIRSLPIGFKKLGFDTHDRFDKIAKMAREKAKKEELNQELSGLLNNCTACHASYKFVNQ